MFESWKSLATRRMEETQFNSLTSNFFQSAYHFKQQPNTTESDFARTRVRRRPCFCFRQQQHLIAMIKAKFKPRNCLGGAKKDLRARSGRWACLVAPRYGANAANCYPSQCRRFRCLSAQPFSSSSGQRLPHLSAFTNLTSAFSSSA